MNMQSPFYHEEQYRSLAQVRDMPITICGVGSLGGPIAENLARMGYARLTLIDNGRVEERNLSCQPYVRADIGAWKVKALANALYRAVAAKITPVAVLLDENSAGGHLVSAALIIDALDNRAGRKAVSASALCYDIPCLHVGFSADGLYGSGLWEPDYLIPQDGIEGPCEYPLTRPFAQVLAALACRVVGDSLLEGVKQDVELTWGDMQVSVRKR
jgi:hypothetical protein